MNLAEASSQSISRQEFDARIRFRTEQSSQTAPRTDDEAELHLKEMVGDDAIALLVEPDNPEVVRKEDKNRNPCYNTVVNPNLVEYIMKEEKLADRHRESFTKKLVKLILDLKMEDKRAALQGRPLRDYRPREGIINYLTAADGAGPWLEAGLLTKPFLLKNAPSAYRSVRNLEARGLLPPELKIPNRSDIVDHELTELGIDLSTDNGRRRIARLRSAAVHRMPKRDQERT